MWCLLWTGEQLFCTVWLLLTRRRSFSGQHSRDDLWTEWRLFPSPSLPIPRSAWLWDPITRETNSEAEEGKQIFKAEAFVHSITLTSFLHRFQSLEGVKLSGWLGHSQYCCSFDHSYNHFSSFVAAMAHMTPWYILSSRRKDPVDVMNVSCLNLKFVLY